MLLSIQCDLGVEQLSISKNYDHRPVPHESCLRNASPRQKTPQNTTHPHKALDTRGTTMNNDQVWHSSSLAPSQPPWVVSCRVVLKNTSSKACGHLASQLTKVTDSTQWPTPYPLSQCFTLLWWRRFLRFYRTTNKHASFLPSSPSLSLLSLH